jgi:exopolysaccharide biosynthesis polyprenyl glycosylphosphotransferase
VTIALITAGDATAVALAVVLVDPPLVGAVVFAAVLAVALLAARLYHVRANLSAVGDVPAQATAIGVALLVVALADLVGLRALGLDDPVPVGLAAVTALLLPLGRLTSYGVVRRLRRQRLVRDPVLVIGADEVGVTLARLLEERADHGLQPIGFVDDIDPAGAPTPLLGELSSLERLLSQLNVRRVIVAFGRLRDEDLVRALRAALSKSIEVYVVPRYYKIGIDGAAPNGDCIACIPLQRLRPAAPCRCAWRGKRVFDLAVAAGALVVLTPLLLALAAGVRLTSRGPVLFRQRRVGQFGREFELLKFRTLKVNNDSDVCWSVVGDHRQTVVGRWMRRFSLDELPQLWNIVRGDMSLIGPRPERPHFVAEFSSEIPEYADRHRVPVGLTGWAQVNGLRGDTSIADRTAFDNHYIDDWSLRRDVSILGATVGAVLRDGRRKRSA